MFKYSYKDAVLGLFEMEQSLARPRGGSRGLFLRRVHRSLVFLAHLFFAPIHKQPIPQWYFARLQPFDNVIYHMLLIRDVHAHALDGIPSGLKGYTLVDADPLQGLQSYPILLSYRSTPIKSNHLVNIVTNLQYPPHVNYFDRATERVPLLVFGDKSLRRGYLISRFMGCYYWVMVLQKNRNVEANLREVFLSYAELPIFSL